MGSLGGGTVALVQEMTKREITIEIHNRAAAVRDGVGPSRRPGDLWAA